MPRPPGYRRDAKGRCRQALVAANGNLGAAAKILGITRSSVWEMVDKHQDLRDLCAELNETRMDNLEDKLYESAMQQSNTTAAIATLNAKAKHRGWGYYKTDVVHSGTIEHNHHLHDHRRLKDVTDADLERLIEERRAALQRLPAGGPAPVMIDVTPRADSTDT